MFELICPSCRATRNSSFVRIGAATRCPQCGHTWRISTSHFAMVSATSRSPGPDSDSSTGVASGSVADVPETGEPAIDEPPPEGDPRVGSSVMGMSGLSDLMQAEPHAVPHAAAGRSVAPLLEAKLRTLEDHSAAAQADRSGASSFATMSRPSRRLAILIIALLALGVAMAGLGLILLGGEPTAPGSTTAPGNSPASGYSPAPGGSPGRPLSPAIDPDTKLPPVGPSTPPQLEPGPERGSRRPIACPSALARRPLASTAGGVG